MVAGCDTDKLHDMNINPNSLNEMDVNYLFTTAELTAANGFLPGSATVSPNEETNIEMCGPVIQHLATLNNTGNSAGDKYIQNWDNRNSLYGPIWNFMYHTGTQAHKVIEITSPGGYDAGRKVNTHHAARIIKVFCFHRMTDWYGNIPYFEALRGDEGIFFPKYDKQKDIYADLLKELDEACAGLSTANFDDGFSASDIIFSGDISRWKRWGYSLMLRLAMRVSNVDKSMADTYVTKAVSGGVMRDNEDNPWVRMASGPAQMNYNLISYGFDPGRGRRWSEFLISKTMIDWLMGSDKTTIEDDDPRLMIFTAGIVKWTPSSVTPLPGGTDPLNQKGLPNGLDQAILDDMSGRDIVAYEHYSSVNPLLMKPDAPYQLMNSAECQFLMAEALERGIGSGIPGTAREHYDLGVKQAMRLYAKHDLSLAVSDERVAEYLELYPYGVAKPALEMIGEQLWASKFMNWWEAWSDWRRTGYPVLIPVNYPGNATNGQIPTKLPVEEDESNNPNYEAGVTRPDDLTGKVWWDGGPE